MNEMPVSRGPLDSVDSEQKLHSKDLEGFGQAVRWR